MQLDNAIKGRISVRKFSSKKPDWRDIIEAIDLARYAPMAGNNFTLKFVVVDDENKIRKIAEAAEQLWIADAKYLVVACSEEKRAKNLFGEKGERYLRQQAGAGIQNFLLKIEETGLSTCWIGHFSEGLIKRELKIPDEIVIEALFPIGYALNPPQQKHKVVMDSILYFNKWKQKRMKPLEKLEV